MPPAVSSIPRTPRRDGAAAALPRRRTVSAGGSGATGSLARSLSHSHHQRRSSLCVLSVFGECATPRPFLKRVTGTGGAAAATSGLRTTMRVHDLPTVDAAATAITPRPLPQQHQQEQEHTQVNVPFDPASLDGHRFPMTQAVGISG